MPKQPSDGDPRPQTFIKKERVSHPCLSLTRSSHQTHHAVMLPTPFLPLRTYRRWLPPPDVNHLEQGAKVQTACVCSACAWIVVEGP